MGRFEERRREFSNAVQRLKEALEEKETDIVIDGVLHRFEFTFELAWKTMKDYLEYVGVIEKTGSPREIIKSAFEYGMIEDGESWINMMLARNSLSHLYDEEKSREVYKNIKNIYFELLNKLKNKFNEKLLYKVMM